MLDIRTVGQRCLQTASSAPKSNFNASLRLNSLPTKNDAPINNLLKYQFAALNINNGNIISPSIIPPNPNRRIEEPAKDERNNVDTPDPLIVKEITEQNLDNLIGFDLPPIEGQNESIEAARMIEIRRLKMKKHKRKKFLKKMKFVLAKIRLRRRMAKEKVFQASLLAQIRQAENFSAEQYVTDKLTRLKDVPPPKPEIVKIF